MSVVEEIAMKYGLWLRVTDSGFYKVCDGRALIAINEALERAALTALDEAVELVGPGDEAYNMALEHAAAAIRRLKYPTEGGSSEL